jgi:hypothetical protein
MFGKYKEHYQHHLTPPQYVNPFTNLMMCNTLRRTIMLSIHSKGKLCWGEQIFSVRKGVDRMCVLQIYIDTNCISPKTCISRVLSTDLTYSHVPGDQRGLLFSDFRMFPLSFLHTNWYTTISIVNTNPYTNWYKVQLSLYKIAVNELVYIKLYNFITKSIFVCTNL